MSVVNNSYFKKWRYVDGNKYREITVLDMIESMVATLIKVRLKAVMRSQIGEKEVTAEQMFTMRKVTTHVMSIVLQREFYSSALKRSMIQSQGPDC